MADTKEESRREVAKQIVTSIGLSGQAEKRVTDAIEAALKERDERAAKIAEAEYADPNWHQYYRTAAMVIARAIRNEDTNA